MKIAILSDIHGNKYSLRAAKKKMDELRIDKFIFCGDALGYYYGHNEVIDYLRIEKNFYCVLGNHDQMFIDIFDGVKEKNTYLDKYGSSIEEFLETITKENMEFLRDLPREKELILDELRIKIVHGSPWDHLNEYIYPDSGFDRYLELDYDYFFQGHTHHKMITRLNKSVIVNPGSLGQPRDGGYPSFAVLDTKTKNIEFITVKYDIHDLLNDIQIFPDEPSYISDVLWRPIDERRKD